MVVRDLVDLLAHLAKMAFLVSKVHKEFKVCLDCKD
jgi:hypothetical protein